MTNNFYGITTDREMNMAAHHFIPHKTRNTFGTKAFGVLAIVTINILLAAGTSPAGGTEDTNYKYVPLTIESKLYGTIKKLPAGRVGTWLVNSREILITGKTKISEEYGKAVVGAYVEVEGTNTGKVFTASKIAVKRASQ